MDIGPKKALAAIRKSADLEGNNGIFLLAKVYDDGLCGVEKNLDKALSLYNKIARFQSGKNGWSSYPPAVKKLAWLYQGNNGAPLDAAKAIQWLDFQGDDKAYFQIGQLYDYGKGIKQNHQLAFENYLKSAKLGNKHAAHKVAQCYEKGIGVEKNRKEAERWKGK